MTDNFYKYIQKRKNSYSIIKRTESGTERYGTYSKITDALYERDRLIESNWDWDDYLQMEETDNPYEQMILPHFVHDTSYICVLPQNYKVYLKREYKGTFRNKRDAENFAERINGRVVSINKKYKVQKSVDGKLKYFGIYPTLEEAQKVRDELIKNGWKK